ncbi:phage tail protein [Cupriavidus gilardii]|uniref:phage tail protein n=1 Tax=Cupriavidus gilardii TaxID=82541 RepID=UPI0021B4C294|nr:phage tail protein [Cupriavidus gilardii]UXC38291.1 tail fiber protein [Cupriavidus gilardii]
MAKQTINLGTPPAGTDGDTARSAFTKVNANFTELYDGAQADATARVGSIVIFARNTAPAGYLKANGAAVSRTTFAALFAVIGTTFGAGNGSSTFNLPDLRGEFIRGWDDGRGVDPGRAFGSLQAQSTQAHKHLTSIGFDENALYQWRDNVNTPAFGSIVDTAASRFAITQGPISTVGRFAYTDAVLNQLSGETRPRNIALLACIKH